MPLRDLAVQRIIERFGSISSFLDHYSGDRVRQRANDDSCPEITSHVEAEVLLLKIGRMLEYDTYSPDRSKRAYGERVGDHCTLDRVPTRFLGELVPIISQIDVIWFRDDLPRYAFEVEHTTKVGSGLQRLFQLHPLSTALFIIAGEEIRPRYEKLIETDPYFRYRQLFRFRTYRELESYFRAVSELQLRNRTFLGDGPSSGEAVVL
jgi:hypothetical protein